jgi:hypothetical protein
MMKSKKNGDRAVPRIVWDTKAWAHLKFVSDLNTLPESVEVTALIKKHQDWGDVCATLAAETVKGRPKSPKAIPTNALIAFRSNKPRPKRTYDQITYDAVADMRKFLRSTNKKKGSAADAIRALLECTHKDKTVSLQKHQNDNFGRVKVAYQRGKP